MYVTQRKINQCAIAEKQAATQNYVFKCYVFNFYKTTKTQLKILSVDTWNLNYHIFNLDNLLTEKKRVLLLLADEPFRSKNMF